MTHGQDCGRGLSRAQHWTIPVPLVFFPPYPPESLSAGHFFTIQIAAVGTSIPHSEKWPQVLLSDPFLFFPARFPLNSQVFHCDKLINFPHWRSHGFLFVWLVVLTESIYIKNQGAVGDK